MSIICTYSSSSPSASKALKVLVCLSTMVSLGSTALEEPKFLLLGFTFTAVSFNESLNFSLSSVPSSPPKDFLGLVNVAHPSSSTISAAFLRKLGLFWPSLSNRLLFKWLYDLSLPLSSM